jgi:type I restriction enzyme R subunit
MGHDAEGAQLAVPHGPRVSDIVFDFSVKPRLSSERGNAILVASSIYDACKYFSLFQKTPFKGKCAVVTSYNRRPEM